MILLEFDGNGYGTGNGNGSGYGYGGDLFMRVIYQAAIYGGGI